MWSNELYIYEITTSCTDFAHIVNKLTEIGTVWLFEHGKH